MHGRAYCDLNPQKKQLMMSTSDLGTFFQSEDYDTLLMFDCFQYRSCKLLWKSCVEHHAFFRLSVPPTPHKRSNLLLLTLGSKFRYSGRTEYQTREDKSFRNLSKEKERERRTFFRSPSKRLLLLRQTLRAKVEGQKESDKESPYHQQQADFQGNQLNLDLTANTSPNRTQFDQDSFADQYPRPMMHRSANIMNLKVAAATGLVRGNDKVQSYEKEPRKAWGEHQLSPRMSDE